MTRRACAALVLVLALALAGVGARAEDRQALEAELFADAAPTTVVATADPLTALVPEAKTVGFSGEITSAVVDVLSTTLGADSLYTYTVGNVFLDARLARQAKVFANLEATYLSQGQATLVTLRELFFDFNLAQAAYFRTGKQVLQWGRCYLWNPTDLVNVERPRFVRKIGYREGAYGMKVHVPFGVGVNFYDFIDTGTALQAETAANALKVEVLIGNLEVALSGWGKKGYHPVWGLDLSTRVLGVDLLGEVGVSRGENFARARVVDGVLTAIADPEAWAPRASLDLSRSFTVGDFKDRMTVMLEGYYDRTGYEGNPLSDPTLRPFARPVTSFTPSGPVVTAQGTFRDFLDLNELFQPNYFSRAYVAVFTTFTRFLLTDLTLSANYVHNLSDHSSLVSTGLTYAELNTFTLGLLANRYLGAPDTEYTFSGQKYDLQLTFGISF